MEKKRENLFIIRVMEIGLMMNCVKKYILKEDTKKGLKEVCKCIGLKAFCLLLHICCTL